MAGKEMNHRQKRQEDYHDSTKGRNPQQTKNPEKYTKSQRHQERQED
jgi:hypothetical protein